MPWLPENHPQLELASIACMPGCRYQRATCGYWSEETLPGVAASDTCPRSLGLVVDPGKIPASCATSALQVQGHPAKHRSILAMLMDPQT